eukprot:Gregarina_sp_Poly_1__5242@NODE_277_length_10206_cov_85_389782_g241_i0_p1_GENE_NODE_277_length_10206_cov_85_389782_g241_i0NODE_277_length_10206_cov_85_389782_g241_i0_p1_ORF_typecomplete_len866_score108_17Fboxlike/PF12937_7/0_046Fboxlike/PF12937_7/1_4e03NopRA1/PF16201_5/7e03NopRA1/PF16201_5/6_2e03NopRA1/PF16201_5/0_082_NODE_277_length_10206_cov_85_389782_g241_i062168813
MFKASETISLQNECVLKSYVKSMFQMTQEQIFLNPFKLTKGLYIFRTILDLFHKYGQVNISDYWLDHNMLRNAQQTIHEVLLACSQQKLHLLLRDAANAGATCQDLEIATLAEVRDDLSIEDLPASDVLKTADDLAVTFYELAFCVEPEEWMSQNGSQQFCTHLIQMYTKIAELSQGVRVFSLALANKDNFFGRLFEPPRSLPNEILSELFQLLAIPQGCHSNEKDCHSYLSTAEQLKKVSHLQSLLALSESLEDSRLTAAMIPAVCRALSAIAVLSAPESENVAAWLMSPISDPILPLSNPLSPALKGEVVLGVLSNAIREKAVFDAARSISGLSMWENAAILHIQAHISSELVPRRLLTLEFVNKRTEILATTEQGRLNQSEALAIEWMSVLLQTEAESSIRFLDLLRRSKFRPIFTKSFESTPRLDELHDKILGLITLAQEPTSAAVSEASTASSQHHEPAIVSTSKSSLGSGTESLSPQPLLRTLKSMLRKSQFDQRRLISLIADLSIELPPDIDEYLSKIISGVIRQSALDPDLVRLIIARLGQIIKSTAQQSKIIDNLLIHHAIIRKGDSSALMLSPNFVAALLTPDLLSKIKDSAEATHFMVNLICKVLQCLWIQTPVQDKLEAIPEDEIYDQFLTYPQLDLVVPVSTDEYAGERRVFFEWIALHGVLALMVQALNSEMAELRRAALQCLAIYSMSLEFDLMRCKLEFLDSVESYEAYVANLRRKYSEEKFAKQASRLRYPIRRYPFQKAVEVLCWLAVIRQQLPNSPSNAKLDQLVSALIVGGLSDSRIWMTYLKAQLRRENGKFSFRSFEMCLWNIVRATQRHDKKQVSPETGNLRAVRFEPVEKPECVVVRCCGY